MKNRLIRHLFVICTVTGALSVSAAEAPLAERLQGQLSAQLVEFAADLDARLQSAAVAPAPQSVDLPAVAPAVPVMVPVVAPGTVVGPLDLSA
ncbi:MAG: hypothetical protein H6978_03460 [Gammaproteobacteria bacterium]|nr:hypothetical protein [Gammaproteobacteria bacterium]